MLDKKQWLVLPDLVVKRDKIDVVRPANYTRQGEKPTLIFVCEYEHVTCEPFDKVLELMAGKDKALPNCPQCGASANYKHGDYSWYCPRCNIGDS